MATIDFEGIGKQLLSRAREYVPGWLPGGKLLGDEWRCGDIRGGAGNSFGVNLVTGKWGDLNGGADRGGDLIALYAAIMGVEQGDAAKELADQLGMNVVKPVAANGNGNGHTNGNGHVKDKKKELLIGPPPMGIPTPSMVHYKYGEPSMAWAYHSPQGEKWFYIGRYEDETGKKQFIPWCWSHAEHTWVNKQWPEPRPLYNLHKLTEHPDKAVCVVEGEKAAEAAAHILGKAYVIVTWPGGVNAWNMTDWSPIAGRRVLLWPDADSTATAKSKKAAHEGGVHVDNVLPYHKQPGPLAMFNIAQHILKDHDEVKIINVADRPDGWDAADALDESWDFKAFAEWATSRINLVKIHVPVAQPAWEPATSFEVAKIEKPKPPEKTPEQLNIAVHDDLGVVNGSMYAFWESCHLANTKSGQPIMNMANIIRIFNNQPLFKDFIWYDEFHNQFYTHFNFTTEPCAARVWTDGDMLSMLHFLQDKCGFTKINHQAVEQAVRTYANKRVRNEPLDWMKSLEWDGNPRIADFFTNCFGAKDTEYVKAASRNWWVSMAARTFKPGCKMDNMVVLEGLQGVFKSTVLNIVGGKWYGTIAGSPDSKDFLMSLQGKLLLEVEELDSFARAEESTIKRIITVKEDRFRPPYERVMATFPRRCVMVGTTNKDDYLRDFTGGRRFWPIYANAIDRDWAERDRDQLFAEAVHLFVTGEKWWEMPHETKAEQAARQEQDIWTYAVLEYLNGPQSFTDEVTTRAIATVGLKIDENKLDRRIEIRIANILKSIGWSKPGAGKRWIDGKKVNVWCRPENDTTPRQMPLRVNTSDLPNHADGLT